MAAFHQLASKWLNIALSGIGFAVSYDAVWLFC